MKKIITVLLALFTVLGCSKYEEGPKLSLLSRKARVANIWEIDSAYANGENVTEEFERYELQLSVDGDAEIDAEFSFFGSEYKANTDGTWELKNDDELLELDFEKDEFDNSYQILKLTANEMYLRVKGEDMEIHLVTK